MNWTWVTIKPAMFPLVRGEKLPPMKYSPRLGELDDRTEHTLAQLPLHGTILQGVVQRLAKEVLNLIAVQHAHPLAPQRSACALKVPKIGGKFGLSLCGSTISTVHQSAIRLPCLCLDTVVNSARNYADKHLPFLFIYLILLACSPAVSRSLKIVNIVAACRALERRRKSEWINK